MTTNCMSRSGLSYKTLYMHIQYMYIFVSVVSFLAVGHEVYYTCVFNVEFVSYVIG